MTRLYLDYSRLMQQQITKIVQDEWAAEDLMQTTLVKLIDKVQDLRTKDRNHLINYIISACKNQARNYMRDKNRHAEYSIDEYDNAMVTALRHDSGSIRRGGDASQQQAGKKTGCKTSSLHRVYLQSLLMGSWYRKSWWVSKNIEALELSKSFYTNDHHSISSFFSSLHTPAVIWLIHHAGDKGDDVLRAVV